MTTEEITDPHALDIQLRVNGEMRQDSNTGDMIFKIPQLIEFISQDLTLKPGDIISTGTPSGVGVSPPASGFLEGRRPDRDIHRADREADIRGQGPVVRGQGLGKK